MKLCCAACFERTRSAVAVLEKLDVRDLFPLETRQEAKWRGDFLPSYVRLVGKRAEEGDAATLLNGVGDVEVERFPVALDCPKDIGQRLRPLVSASPGHNFLQFGVVEAQRDIGNVRRHELPQHFEIRCVLQKLLKHSGQIGCHLIVLSFLCLFFQFVLNEITVRGFDFFGRQRCGQKGYWR